MYRYKTFCPLNNDLKIFVIFFLTKKERRDNIVATSKKPVIKKSSFTQSLQRAVVGGNAAGESTVNGLMRAARKRLRVAADGFRTRYQSGLYVCIRNERSVFPAIWVVPQDSKSCPIYGIRLFLFAYKEKRMKYYLRRWRWRFLNYNIVH